MRTFHRLAMVRLLAGLAAVTVPGAARADDAPPNETAPAASAPPSGDPAAEAGLRADLERIVATEEALGWYVDQVAIKNLYPTLLRSVCATPAAARIALLDRLELESRNAGVAKDLFVAAGREWTPASKRALRAERLALALRAATDGAEKDCPFWVTPEPGFRGLQTDEGRFTLSLETGGLVFAREARGDYTYGAGGAGRVLFGHGFRGGLGLRGGPELGGAALVNPARNDASIAVTFFPAIPLILSYRAGLWRYDLESALVGTWQGNLDESLQLGFRGGFNVAVSALRTQGFLPWFGVGIAFERYFPRGELPAQHYLRGGLRVGFVWAP